MSRNFYLINSTGQVMPLWDEHRFFYEPSGLGFGESAGYQQVEYGFFARSEARAWSQPQLGGTLVFKRGGQDPYYTYQQFVDWVQQSTDLQLVYVPYGGRELYMDVELASLELSEKTETGVLECPIQFIGTSPYHRKNPLTFLLSTEGAENPMAFSFTFPFAFSSSSAGGTITFTPSGHFPAALELTLCGPLSGPYFRCENPYTGQVYGALDLSGVSLAEGDQIYYSSRPNADGVWKISGNTRTDLVEFLNTNLENFFTIPVGQPCRAILQTETAEPDAVHTLHVHEYFKG